MTFNQFIEEWLNPEDFISVQTSGSTGKPKRIKLQKKFMTESAQRTINFFKLNKNSRLHSCVSPDFIGGKMMAVRAEICGAKLTWEIPSNTPLKDLNSSETIDLLAVVPSQMISIIDNIKSLPRINNIIVGGSPIHPSLREKIFRSGLNVYETYGMTETASHIALRKISKHEVPFSSLPGIRISSNSENCLVIRFDSGEIFHTNDLVKIISENEFYIQGRADEIIISGGKKINPSMVEKKLAKFFNNPFCISSIPDEKWGQKIVLLIEGECEIGDWKDKFKNVLEDWEIPKDIFIVKKLPRTSNGKIIRHKDLLFLSSFESYIDLSSLMQNKQE